MADDEILRRLDEHMARGNEIMRRSNEVIEENRLAFQDFRGFLRELTLRHERATNRLVEVLEDLVEESRAQRAALFLILDRLDGGGAPSGA